MYLYINGNFIKQREAVISPFDHGFLYGVGLFETFRIYNRHPFLIDDHLTRLNQGLEVLNIDIRYNRAFILGILEQLLEINGLSDAYIRLNVSAGVGEIGLQTEAYKQPNLILFAKKLQPAGEIAEKKAVLLELSRNSPEGYERLKSHHYLNNIFAKREIGGDTGKEGIFLTKEGYLAEGIVSNLFWTKNNILFTPSIDTGILNGVTRQFLLKSAEKLRLEVQEGFFKSNEAAEADEVFLTNSIQEIVPVTDFGDREKPGRMGRIVNKLHQLYRECCYTLWSRNDLS